MILVFGGNFYMINVFCRNFRMINVFRGNFNMFNGLSRSFHMINGFSGSFYMVNGFSWSFHMINVFSGNFHMIYVGQGFSVNNFDVFNMFLNWRNMSRCFCFISLDQLRFFFLGNNSFMMDFSRGYVWLSFGLVVVNNFLEMNRLFFVRMLFNVLNLLSFFVGSLSVGFLVYKFGHLLLMHCDVLWSLVLNVDLGCNVLLDRFVNVDVFQDFDWGLLFRRLLDKNCVHNRGLFVFNWLNFDVRDGIDNVDLFSDVYWLLTRKIFNNMPCFDNGGYYVGNYRLVMDLCGHFDFHFLVCWLMMNFSNFQRNVDWFGVDLKMLGCFLHNCLNGLVFFDRFALNLNLSDRLNSFSVGMFFNNVDLLLIGEFLLMLLVMMFVFLGVVQNLNVCIFVVNAFLSQRFSVFFNFMQVSSMLVVYIDFGNMYWLWLLVLNNDWFCNLSFELFNSGWSLCFYSSLELGRRFLDVLIELTNLLFFARNGAGIFLFKIDTYLVVYERNDHAVVQWNQVRWLVLDHLAVRFHKDKGAV